MPDVPNLPGVPALSSYSSDPIALLTEDAVSLIGALSSPQWGIFLNGESVIAADSVVDFDYDQNFEISDYPQEQGAFESYNKAQRPAVIRMRFAAGGSEANRQNFFASIDAVMNDTNLYDVVTPEETYLNFNFMHRDYHRSAENGVGLIIVDIWLKEIMVTGSASINTATPAVAGQQSNGNVQAQTPSQSEDALFSGNFQ